MSYTNSPSDSQDEASTVPIVDEFNQLKAEVQDIKSMLTLLITQLTGTQSSAMLPTPTKVPPTPLSTTDSSTGSASLSSSNSIPYNTPAVSTMATVVITGNAGEWPLSAKLKEKLKTQLDIISIAELVREFKHYRNTNTSGIVPSFLRMVPQDAILDLSRKLNKSEELYKLAFDEITEKLYKIYTPASKKELVELLKTLTIPARRFLPTARGDIKQLATSAYELLSKLVDIYTMVDDQKCPSFHGHDADNDNYMGANSLSSIINQLFIQAEYTSFFEYISCITFPPKKGSKLEQLVLFRHELMNLFDRMEKTAHLHGSHDYLDFINKRRILSSNTSRQSQQHSSSTNTKSLHKVHHLTHQPDEASDSSPAVEFADLAGEVGSDESNHQLNAFSTSSAARTSSQICFTAANHPEGTCTKHLEGKCGYNHDKPAIKAYRQQRAAELLSFET